MNSFDKVLILSQGRVVYYGLPRNMTTYVTNLGFEPLSDCITAADFMLALLHHSQDSSECSFTFKEPFTGQAKLMPALSPQARALGDKHVVLPRDLLEAAFDHLPAVRDFNRAKEVMMVHSSSSMYADAPRSSPQDKAERGVNRDNQVRSIYYNMGGLCEQVAGGSYQSDQVWNMWCMDKYFISY